MEGETEAKEDGLRSCSSPSLSWMVGASAPSELASDLNLVVRRWTGGRIAALNGGKMVGNLEIVGLEAGGEKKGCMARSWG